jgi:hypothetical protein
MALRYGRDAYFAGTGMTSYHNFQQEASVLIYNLLRVGGAEWIWECDGEVGPNADNPNHVTDGNMETSGAANYAAVGTGAVAKDSTTYQAGTQSLKITSNASGDGGVTSALLSIRNATGRAFDLSDVLTGPTLEQMIVNDNNTPFTTADIGALITISGEANPGNNGTFVITKYIDTTHIQYENPSGTGTVPTGSWVINAPYEIVLWAKNSSGVSWDVEVDQGDGSFVNVGSIPDNSGVWTRYHFQFVGLSSGSRYIRVVCPSAGVHEINIDSLLVFRSVFEYARINKSGSDGILTNPDRFSTAGSFTPSDKDIGRWLLVWDAAHPENCGWFQITSVAAPGVVVVSMRSGTATFTNASSLSWRIVDLNQFWSFPPSFWQSCGFGIKSPHSSGWRLFSRLCLRSSGGNYFTAIWAAPNDEASFDMSTGTFYPDGPSTQRTLQGPASYKYNDATTYLTLLTVSPTNAGYTDAHRVWLMTDDDLSFISHYHMWNHNTNCGFYVVGYMGADPSLPDIEEFAVLAPRVVASGEETTWDDNDAYAAWGGVTFSPDGKLVRMTRADFGYGGTAGDVVNMSNAGPNPWSGEEVIWPMQLGRDPTFEAGCPAERETDIGIYAGRQNLPVLATFDSNEYLHLSKGVIWKWDGVSIL